jgi:hypothetical protein
LQGGRVRAATALHAVTPSGGTPLETDWVVGRSAINLIDAFWGNDSLAVDAFDRPGTRVTYGRPAGWSSESTASFDAVGPVTFRGSFLYDLAHHLIPARTKAVLLDLEDWTLSPADEAREPAYFLDKFVAIAHHNGYEAIVAPGTDLTKVMRCYQPDEPTYLNYLDNCDLPQLVGQARPDIYEIQAQYLENNTSVHANCDCYAWFVDTAAAEARHVDPGLSVFATLASDPEGSVSTPQVLYTDTMHTRSAVAGYALNVPLQSKACPSCTPSGSPQVAADYLSMLGYVGTGERAQQLQAYWLAAADGEIFAAGVALPLGGVRTPASDPVVGVAATPDEHGYWVVTADGGVTAFDDAHSFGNLNDLDGRVSDIVALVPTVDGHGYWLIGRDGGEFAFGDAHYLGSLPGHGIHVDDIAGMAATAAGEGYWVVARDGGIFAFGDARYLGSLPGIGVHRNNTVAMIPASSRGGYILVGSDGGTFVFGHGVSYFGSLPGQGIHVNDIVGLALTRGDLGYWLAGSNGSVYEFGNAQSYEFVSSPGAKSPIVSIAGG